MEERISDEGMKALRFIARREERGDPSPGMNEIRCATGLEGSSAVHNVLSALIGGGYLVQDAGWTRMLELTERGWRLLEDLTSAERDAARRDEARRDASEGEPLEARDGYRRRLLRPSAESLSRAGMSEGDMLVVEDDPEPADGELVVALAGGETRIMRARLSAGSLVLFPAAQITADPADGPAADSPGVEPPLPASEAELQGRVVYVARPLLT